MPAFGFGSWAGLARWPVFSWAPLASLRGTMLVALPGEDLRPDDARPLRIG